MLIAFVPAVVLGLLFGKAIKAHLFNARRWWPAPSSSAASSSCGPSAGPASAVRIQQVDDMTPLDALKVGLVQCLAMMPGTSRSGATIIGGMLLGLSRKAATDFSFFLAIPTLIGAGAYSLLQGARAAVASPTCRLFGVGLLFSFVSAWFCVRWLLRYIATHDFVPFAWYRIVFGAVVLITAWTGWVNWSA